MWLAAKQCWDVVDVPDANIADHFPVSAFHRHWRRLGLLDLCLGCLLLLLVRLLVRRRGCCHGGVDARACSSPIAGYDTCGVGRAGAQVVSVKQPCAWESQYLHALALRGIELINCFLDEDPFSQGEHWLMAWLIKEVEDARTVSAGLVFGDALLLEQSHNPGLLGRA